MNVKIDVICEDSVSPPGFPPSEPDYEDNKISMLEEKVDDRNRDGDSQEIDTIEVLVRENRKNEMSTQRISWKLLWLTGLANLCLFLCAVSNAFSVLEDNNVWKSKIFKNVLAIVTVIIAIISVIALACAVYEALNRRQDIKRQDKSIV